MCLQASNSYSLAIHALVYYIQHGLQHWHAALIHRCPAAHAEMCICRSIVTGKPSPLNSSFKLSYYTLLNLLRRVEDSGHDMEYVIAHSFQQFQFERSLPEVGSVICAHACWRTPGILLVGFVCICSQSM